MNLVPDSESNISSIILILVCFVWFHKKCTLFCTLGPFCCEKGIKSGGAGYEVKEGSYILVHFSMYYLWLFLFLLSYIHSAINCSAGNGGA